MKKHLGKIVLICLIVGIIGIFVIQYLNERTIFHDTLVTGNTAGNLYNGGIYCEYDGLIYFGNYNDDGSLYVMNNDCTDIRKLSNDRISYINVDENYIYYSRNNNEKESPIRSVFIFFNAGLFRIDRTGGNLQLLCQKPSALASLCGNYVYFQHYDKSEGITFHRVKIDGTDHTQISPDPIIPASITDGILLYAGTGKEHNLHTLDVNTLSVSDFADGNFYMPIVNNSYVYYLSLADDYALCRMDLDGSNPVTLVNEFISFYNITADGSHIYFQIDGAKDNRFCVYDVASGEVYTLMDGNYKQIHITTHYVFFRDYNETNTFVFDPVTNVISTFHPPVDVDFDD